MRASRALYGRLQALIHELAKFGIVGVANTALDFALFNYLHFGRGMNPLSAKAISTIVAATSSYFMNRHWSFRHRARTGLKREYPLFFLLNAIGLVIAFGCVGTTRYVFGFTSVLALNVFGNGLGLVLGTTFRFWSYRRWVFLPHPENALPHAVAGGSVTEVPFADEPDDTPEFAHSRN